MAQNILEIRNLETRINGTLIHKNLDMDVQKGEIFGIVGGSGSGKTVLLNTILGLRHQKGGTITLFGLDAQNKKAADQIRRRYGVLFQSGALFSSLTVLDNITVPMIEMAGIPKPIARVLALEKMDMVGLGRDAAEKLPEELSGGMIKRTALARALALDAELVFLDEPTSGLDPISAQAFDEMIRDLQKSLGLTVIMITHDLGSLAICDRLGALVDKKMIVGKLKEIKAYPNDWIRAYFSGGRAKVMEKN